MTEVRIGFVGAGGNALGHMRRLKELDGVTIAGVCDLDESRAQAAAGEVGGKVFTDYRKMLDALELEGVYVSVPPFAHESAEILATQKGCALLVEKPVALSVEKGLEILEAIEKAGVISAVGYQLRYTDATQRVRRFLAGKTLAMIHHTRWGGLPGTPWWRVMDKSGGQLVEQTTHGVDIMRYFAGEAVEVYAMYATRTMSDVENLTIPDSQQVMIRFGSGVLATVTTSCMSNAGGGKTDFSLLLRDQRIDFSYMKAEFVPSPGGDWDADFADTPSIDEHFVRAVRERDQSLILSSYRDALKTLDLTLAANESARTGQPVQPYFARS